MNWMKFSRAFFFTLSALLLLAGFIAPRIDSAQAAPNQASAASNIVISQFRTRGPSGANDEFIELYNPTNATVDITGWKIYRSNDTGSPIDHFTIPSASLPAGGYYLITRSGAGNYTGSTAADATYSSSIADEGGIALFLPDETTLVDAVGTHVNSAYQEGSVLAPLSGTADRSYQRKQAGCVDDNNNASDFELINPSAPRNSSSPAQACADLALTQTVDDTSPSVGDTVNFTITLSNNGPSDMSGIQVAINLPPGLSYVSDTGGVGSGSGTWAIASLASGANTTMLLSAQVTSAMTLTNTVSISSMIGADPDADNNSASVQLIPLGTLALNITGSVNNATPAVGDNIILTFQISNPSTHPYAASGVTVSGLVFPFSGLVYVSDDASGAYNPATGIWNAGALSVGQTKTLRVTVQVTSSGSKTVTATLNSTEYLSSSASVTITPLTGTEADLRLSTTSITRHSSMAGVAVLKITINNDGPHTATGVQVKNHLPAGLTYISHSGGSYNPSNGIWTVGSLANGASAVLTLNVRVRASGSSTRNFAEIWSSNQFDPDSTPGNGETGTEDDETSAEVPIADLQLTQSVTTTGTPSSGTAVFTISVKNHGPDDASNVKVKTSLPSSTSVYTFVSYGSSPGTTYTSSTGIWDIGAIPDNETVTLTITTTTHGQLVANWVEVSANTVTDPDSVPNNNSRNEDDDDGKPATDLNLSLSVNTSRPDLGADVIFTLTVSNTGAENEPTSGVQVKFLLPDGLTYRTHSGGTYNKTTGIWDVGNLSVNATKTLTVKARAVDPGTKNCYAQIWASNLSDPDSTPKDNSTSEDDDASVSVSPVSRTKSVIISEVAWAGTKSSSSDEWIELYNPGSSPVNLSGWALGISDSYSSSITRINLPNVSLPGQSFYIIAANAEVFQPGVTINQIASLGLNNSGEKITLYDSSGAPIDQANADGGGWPAGNTTNYATMERNKNYENRLYTSSDTLWEWNTFAANSFTARDRGNEPIYGTPGRTNWAFDVTSTPTPQRTPTRARTPTPSLEGRLIINEILARPGYDWNRDGRVDVFDEFIELKNIGTDKINLKGWRLDDVANGGSDPFNLPSVTLLPGQRLLFFGLETKLLLGDGGDTIRLIGPNNKEYDNYQYIVIKEEDKSICRLPDGNGSWYMDCIPTPNLINTRDGSVPVSPDNAYVSPVCSLPDTLPEHFLIAECRGYGANIWRMYWEVDSLLIFNTKQGTIIE